MGKLYVLWEGRAADDHCRILFSTTNRKDRSHPWTRCFTFSLRLEKKINDRYCSKHMLVTLSRQLVLAEQVNETEGTVGEWVTDWHGSCLCPSHERWCAAIILDPCSRCHYVWSRKTINKSHMCSKWHATHKLSAILMRIDGIVILVNDDSLSLACVDWPGQRHLQESPGIDYVHIYCSKPLASPPFLDEENKCMTQAWLSSILFASVYYYYLGSMVQYTRARLSSSRWVLHSDWRRT